MGVLVGLITLLLLIGGALGFFEYRRWKEIRKHAEESKEEAERCAEEAKSIIERLRKSGEEELARLRSKIPQISIMEKPSEEIKSRLDEYGERLKSLESFGVQLKFDDYFNQATDFYYKGKYESALKAIEEAIRMKPDNAMVWYNKGVTLGKLGRHGEALKAYDRAIELKPDDAATWYNKGVTLGKLGRHGEALKAYDRAIELKPDAAAWSNKGAALTELGRYDEALKACDRAIELKPDDAVAWYNRACAYSLKSDKGNALRDLSKAVELDAKHKEVAKKDEDFKNLWDDEYFKKIVS
jgi:tetratricopeptide (TPR) repeat protein